MPRSASLLGLWLLGLALCIVVVLISTRISREMTLWGIAASALLLAWFWLQITHAKRQD
jgi:hypothetical protein